MIEHLLTPAQKRVVEDALEDLLEVGHLLERDAAEIVVRARIDGVLFKLKTLPIEWMPSIIERLKSRLLVRHVCNVVATGYEQSSITC